MAGLFGGPANPLAAQPTFADFPDVDLVSPPPECISSIAFSPTTDHLAVGSWGPDVRSSAFVALGPASGGNTSTLILILLWILAVGLSRFGYTT